MLLRISSYLCYINKEKGREIKLNCELNYIAYTSSGYIFMDIYITVYLYMIYVYNFYYNIMTIILS